MEFRQDERDEAEEVTSVGGVVMMQYVAIGIAVVCVYTAAFLKKWWNVCVVFSLIIAAYLFAVFGIKSSRVLSPTWYQKVDSIDGSAMDYVRMNNGSIEILMDSGWCYLNEVVEFNYEYLNYWVVLKDGSRHKIQDKSMIKLLKSVTTGGK